MRFITAPARAAVSWIIRHRISTIVVVIIIALAAWRGSAALNNTSGVPSYELGNVSVGTIIETVSESGQVSATQSVDITPQTSGDITWVGVKVGDYVAAGQALMGIDDTTALQTVANAKQQLASDKLEYQQSQVQAPISYQNDVNALSTDKETLQNDYNTAYNDITSAYLDMPGIISGAQDIIYGYDLDPKKIQWNIDFLAGLFTPNEDTTAASTFASQSKSEYTTADQDYDASLASYQQSTRTSSNDAVDSLLASTVNTVTDTAQTLQTELNYLNAIQDAAKTYNITLPAKFTTIQNNASSNLSTANSHLSTLLADKKTIDNAKQAITGAQQTIELDEVGNPQGNNPISLQESSSTIAKDEQSLANDEADLANYTVYAPFDGVVSAVSAQVGNSASGDVATIVSKNEVADLSLNEVDAAKVKVGDKATLTFDALPNLTMQGTVAEIDPVGTVSQGVVSYDVKVSFDTQNDQVKPGMTVNAAIIVGTAQNALTVPSSAVQTTASGSSYVLAFVPPLSTPSTTPSALRGAARPPGFTPSSGSKRFSSSTRSFSSTTRSFAPSTQEFSSGANMTTVQTTEVPREIPVQIGLSSDTSVQILSGLSEGQQIIVRSISAESSATTPSTASRGSFGGGGSFRGAAAVSRTF